MRRMILGCVDDSEASLKQVDYIAHNFPGHDIILTHVHCKGTFPRALAGMDGAAYVEDSRDTLDEEAEKRERNFMEHTLRPRIEALGVKVRTDLLHIEGRENKDISAALCKRAEELDPEIMVLSKHCKRPITMFFMGSITQDCFRHAPCPVMFV